MKYQVGSIHTTEIMTVHDLALYLKTSDAKVYRMARTRDLPGFRIGKSWRFKKNMIDMWIFQKTDTVPDLLPDLQFSTPEKMLEV